MDDDGVGAHWLGTFAGDGSGKSPAGGAKRPSRGHRAIPSLFFTLYLLVVGGIAAAIVVTCLQNPDVARYKNASQQAHDAVAAAKEVSQGIRPEWTAQQYREFVERQYAEAGGFLESDEAAELSELAGCLELAFLYYRQVGDYLEARQLSGNESYGRGAMQELWQDAGRLVESADLLLDPETTEQALRDLNEFLREKEERPAATAE